MGRIVGGGWGTAGERGGWLSVVGGKGEGVRKRGDGVCGGRGRGRDGVGRKEREGGGGGGTGK